MTRHNGAHLMIGLTGGIGSGKSLVARRFAQLGALVYHADEVSRRALDPGAACYDRVVAAFGQGILNPDQTIDRKRLGAIVFSDESKRETLNGIIHPYVISALFSRAEHDLNESKSGIAIFEVPLLYESGMEKELDGTILVCSSEESRIARVMKRDGLTREEVLRRIRAQMPEEEKRVRADYILENDGVQEDLFRQVDTLYARLVQNLHPEEPRT